MSIDTPRDIVYRLQCTRADMLGTDDEPVYLAIYDAVDTIRKLRAIEAKYNELICAVTSVTPHQNRHDTALHYICRAEQATTSRYTK